MTSPELNSILANIINGGTIIFCGAGISRDSGLPIVNQIVPSILSKFNLELQEIESILDKSNNPKLPFELFIEILQENSDINDLLSIYEEGEPNLNHLIVANLIKEGKIKTILTTNFDTLLEKALCSKPNCMKQGIDFEVIYDSSQFQEIDWTENKIRIVKLHGSVEDKKNMAITIKQIASHKNLEHITSVIDFAFSKGSHKNILFLGYSASDIFDISPIIESLISNKEIYFIQHSEQFRIENINFQNEKNSFKNFVNGYRIFINTLNFLKSLQDNSLIDKIEYNPLLLKNNNWENNISSWYELATNIFSVANKYYIPARIFYETGNFNHSLSYFIKSLEIEERDGEKAHIANNLYQIGNVFERLGDYSSAIFYTEKSLKIAKAIDNKEIECSNLSSLGICYDNKCEFEIALDYHLSALKIMEKFFFNQKIKKSQILHNIGNSYMSMCKFQEAVKYYDYSYNFSKEIGDKKGEGLSLSNIGNAYNEMGNYKIAEEYYIKSLDIAKKIGNKHFEAGCLILLGTIYTNLGLYSKANNYYILASDIGLEGEAMKAQYMSNIANNYSRLGDYKESLYFYEQAGLIDKKNGNRKEEGRTYNAMGSIYFAMGKFVEANIEFEKSLHIATEIGDEKGKSISYDGIGSCYANNNDFINAIKYHEMSMAISQKINDKNGYAVTLGNIGMAYSELNDFIKAINYTEKSLGIMEEIGDKRSEAECLSQLGIYYDNEGYNEKAISYHKKSLAIAISIGDRENEAKILNRLGSAYMGYENMRDKINCFEKAVSLSIEINNRYGEAISYGNLGNAYGQLGVTQLGIQYLEISYNIFQSLLGEYNQLTIQSKNNLEKIKISRPRRR